MMLFAFAMSMPDSTMVVQQHIDLLVPEVDDDLLKGIFAHLAIADGNLGLRDQISQP
jgi:hypothetical protein